MAVYPIQDLLDARCSASRWAFALTSISAGRRPDHFVSQGGAYQKAQTIAILDPAAKKLGITVNQDSIRRWPVIKSQVASGKPIWDVVDVRPAIACAVAIRADREARLRHDPQCRRHAGGLSPWRMSSIRAFLPIARRNIRRRTQTVGRFLGREEVPRPPRAAQPSIATLERP